MKMIKHICAVAMAIAMILCFGTIPAFAAGGATGTLTIQDTSGATKTTSSYSAYQIVTFDASMLGGKPVFTNMHLNPAYKTAIVGAIPGLTPSSSDSEILTAISGLDAEQSAALAVALKGAATGTADYTAANGVFSALPYGYYLVIETANNANDGTVISKPILVCVPDSNTGDCNVIVKVKTSKAQIEKKIVETDSNGHVILVDSSTAAVGDTVSYQSLSTFPTYSADSTGITYYITDTFSAGLTFQSIGAVKVVDASGGTKATLSEGTDYTLATSGIGNASFRLTLSSSDNIKAWGNAGYKLLVTYSAVLNSGATYGSTGNPNSVRLTYSNKPGVDTYETPDDTVITYTYKLIVTKKSGTGESVTLLPGATFELYRQNGADWDKIDTQTTAADGTASFVKLEQGSYKLVETVAPAGYNLLSDPILFTVGAKNGGIAIPNTAINVTQSGNTAALAFKATWSCDNGSISVGDTKMSLDITNTPGFILPGTGGIGTTVFGVSGGAILLLGGCMAFVYNRKKKKSEQQ